VYAFFSPDIAMPNPAMIILKLQINHERIPMKKALLLSALLYLPLAAGTDRDFIFDIHDAASTTEQYANEAVIVPVYNDLQLSGDFAGVLPDFYSKLPGLLKASGFDPAAKTTALFVDTDSAGNTFTIIASSLGIKANGKFSLESFRRCFARALCQAETNNIQTVHIALPICVESTIKEIAQEIAAITYSALYEYTALATSKPSYKVKRVCVHAHMHTPQDFKDVNIGLRIGSNLGSSLCQARDWINTPSALLTPMTLANNAAQYLLPFIAKIETIIFEKDDIARMAMGGLLGASHGSNDPCTLVVHYLKCSHTSVDIRPSVRASALTFPTIAIIGNGLIDHAHKTNIGISGAAIAYAALNVMAYRNIPANILIITPLAEQPSVELAKGTVLTLSNRKTVEITDPQSMGALMLADAITHAITHYHPDYIIDIATLTDSSRKTFGGHYAAIMGNNADLIQCAYQSAMRTGESVWQLPLSEAYAARLESNVADICNAPAHERTALTQSAGCFLHQSVGATPWLHIDIAGARTAAEYTTKTAPAFGVRLLVDLVESLAKKTQ
jgi:leucyl aminopeptidase